MDAVGIIGTGISGLHLALYLQAAGVPTTVYAPRPLGEHPSSPLPNTVVRWAHTLARECELGIDLPAAPALRAMHIRVAGTPVDFSGTLPAPADATDFRMHLPRLAGAYQERGGNLVIEACGAADLERLSRSHELVVVAAGRDGFGGAFPRDHDRSPHPAPRRHLTVGLYRGVTWPDPAGVEMTLVPGGGEIFHIPFMSFGGPVSGLSVEAIPGGPLDVLERVPVADLPGRMLGLLERFAPELRARIEPGSFALTRPIDMLQGRLTPVVRRVWTGLPCTRNVLAIGDAWITNDPIAAQGANLGSRGAFLLGELIVNARSHDEIFRHTVEDRLWAAAQAPTAISNALLEPPSPHVLDLLGRAVGDQHLADQLCDFGDPEGMLELFAPPVSAPALL